MFGLTGKNGRRLLCVAIVGLLSACATRGGNIPYEVADFGAPDLPVPEEIAYNWPLGPLDVLKISVFQVPELSGEFQVDALGFVDLPLLGRVDVRQQTPENFGAQIEQMYGQRYLNDPDVTVRLMSSSIRTVTIEGGVKQAGVLALVGKTNLLSAIARSGGVDDQYGNPRRVAIFRKRNGQTMAAAFDLISIRRGEMENPIIYPGDTIIVEGNQLRGLYRDLLGSLPLLAIFNPI